MTNPNILEPVIKSLTNYSCIELAIDCLRQVRATNHKGLAYYERDATETALHYLEKVQETWELSPAPIAHIKDEIACIKCGFMVSRPVEGKVRSNCQTCGASYGREAFL